MKEKKEKPKKVDAKRIKQDLRRAFYTFAQTSAAPLIAIMGDDRGSDAETAVTSVLRHFPPHAALRSRTRMRSHRIN